MIKKLISKYFENFVYFYRVLRNKIFVSVGLSVLVGILDGMGLAMFMPLLQMVDGTTKSADPSEMGNLAFVVSWLNNIGIELTFLIVLAIIAVFFIFKGFAKYVQGWYQVVLQQYFIKTIRLNIISSFKNLAYKYFITSDVGRIQNTLTGEVDRVARAYQTYFQSFQYSIMVIVYMLFAFLVDYQFAILVSIGGFLTNLIYKQIYKNTKGASKKLTDDVHDYQGLIIQAVTNFKYLKATGLLGRYSDMLIRQINNIENNNRRIGVLGAILNSSREPLTVLVVCLVIFIQINVLGSSLSAILISLLFFYRALNSLMMMQASWNIYLSVSGSMENMTEFGKELKANKEVYGKDDITNFKESIKLNQVLFNYGNVKILNNINFTVHKNETLAFVGESGSGKTTLVNLISGLLPFNDGNMYVDDIDIKNLNIQSLQTKVGYITQEPVIFNDTIYNNITFWAEKTPENIKRYNEAIEKAAIKDFINSLNEKENTELGNNGINLSGGQKQRISIARELYKQIEILILDEATSALDSDTEKIIQENIDSLKGQYTILIVAHRLSTIKNADRIVVMNSGEIINIGSFKELCETTPYFRKMVELQEL